MITLSEERVGQLLKGHPVEVFVSEPFDFEYPHGGGALRGYVAEVVNADGNLSGEEVLLEVEPFASAEGPTITQLRARRRHKLEKGIIELLADGERVSANLSYAEELEEGAVSADSYPGVIGSVRLLAD